MTESLPNSNAGRTLMVWEQHSDVFRHLPDKMVEAVKSLPNDILEMGEIDLYHACKPTWRDSLVRTKLWKEIRRIEKANNGGKPVMKKILEGVYSENYFYKKVLASQKKVAWFMVPVLGYKDSLEILDELAMMRMGEILTLPFKDKNGSVDHRSVNSFIKAFQIISDKRHGTAVQPLRHEGKVQHDHTAQKVIPPKAEILDQMKDKIRELEAAKKPEVIDVTIESAKNSG